MTLFLTKRQVLVGLGAGTATLAAPAVFAQAAPLKFGVAGPMTGPNAAFGEQFRRGATMAIEDTNAAGGMLGRRIEMQIGDDRSDPREGVSVANKFVSDGIKHVIGHFNSGVSIPTSDVYQENGVVMCTPSSTNPRFTERNLWNTHRTCGRDDQQGDVAAAWLLANRRTAKLAIIHDKTPYGKGLADFTKAGINKGGMNEVIYDGINPGEKDFSALVTRMRQAQIDMVYFGGLHTEAGLIIRQMRDQGMTAVMMSGDGITSKEFWTVAGPGAAGTLMTFNPDPRKNPVAAPIVAKFRAAGFDPEAYTLYSYAAVQSFVEAAKAANSVDPRAIATRMRNGQPLPTVLGPMAWDSKGDLTKADYIMYVWRDGNYIEL